MQMFNIGILPWTGRRRARRLKRLRRLLDAISYEIGTEKGVVDERRENAITNAAFALESIENGESRQGMSEKINRLTASINQCSQRLRSLEPEARFVEATRQQLILFMDPKHPR
jgi:hypothetical protein